MSNVIFLNAYGNDQMSFDVTEIEIIDGGNKIIGKNRGTISTNNGVTINADEFEFDKNKNILKANGNIKITDEINNLEIVGEKIYIIKKMKKLKLVENQIQ